MKRLVNYLSGKISVVKFMNLCALAIAAYSINVTCVYVHHQPKVPEDLKQLRKF